MKNITYGRTTKHTILECNYLSVYYNLSKSISKEFLRECLMTRESPYSIIGKYVNTKVDLLGKPIC